MEGSARGVGLADGTRHSIQIILHSLRTFALIKPSILKSTINRFFFPLRAEQHCAWASVHCSLSGCWGIHLKSITMKLSIQPKGRFSNPRSQKIKPKKYIFTIKPWTFCVHECVPVVFWCVYLLRAPLIIWLAVSWSFSSPTLMQRCNMNVICRHALISSQFKNWNSTSLLSHCSLTALCHVHTVVMHL